MNTRFSHPLEGASTGGFTAAQWRPALRRNRVWLGILAAIIVIAAVWYFFIYTPAAPAPKVHAIPVTAAQAVVRDVPVSISALGAAQAWTSVSVLAQVTGKLLSVNFAEGSDVKAGQVLAEIDPAPYRATLMQAQGALKRDEALLENARVDLARYKTLLTQNAVSAQVDATQAALVKQDEGTVLLDKGQVAAATVNLDWCRITSPISGRVGVRLVDPGNLVSASGSVGSAPSTAAATNASSPTSNAGSGIVIVNQIQPIAVTFTVPEGEFQRLTTLSDGFRKPMTTKAFSQETGQLLDTGQLSIADNRVDSTTGTVELKAKFSNAQSLLWPGQFVNVQLMLEVLPHATTIPVAAVNRGPNGTFLYVVGSNHKVAMRPVVVAWSDNDVAAIKSGVQPGETVVTDGQMTLKAGSLVRIVSPAAAKRQST